MSDAESIISQADITPEQALYKLVFPEHEPNLEAVRCPQCAEKDQELDDNGKVMRRLQNERDGLRDKCAEKDAEIARLNALVEIEIKCRSDLVSELAWIKSERPAVAKTERNLREEIESLKARLSSWHHDGPCYYCGEPTNSLLGNPERWSLLFPHSDDPGKCKPHHVGCVMQRLQERDELKAEVARLNALVETESERPEIAKTESELRVL